MCFYLFYYTILSQIDGIVKGDRTEKKVSKRGKDLIKFKIYNTVKWETYGVV